MTRTRHRCRRSAPSSGSPHSTPPTRSTSSAASGSWPNWSHGSWARPSSRWSDRPAAGSPRPSGPACCRPSRAGCCPDPRAGAVGSCAPAHIRWPPSSGCCPRKASGRVLVVDQFEEVFTLCRDEQERTDFLDALVALAEDRDRHFQVVVAMRADFYGRCATHDRLARLVGANQVLVGPMRREELHRAIVEPARRVGLRVEPSLTDALIADVEDEPGGLPLLSAAPARAVAGARRPRDAPGRLRPHRRCARRGGPACRGHLHAALRARAHRRAAHPAAAGRRRRAGVRIRAPPRAAGGARRGARRAHRSRAGGPNGQPARDHR